MLFPDALNFRRILLSRHENQLKTNQIYPRSYKMSIRIWRRLVYQNVDGTFFGESLVDLPLLVGKLGQVAGEVLRTHDVRDFLHGHEGWKTGLLHLGTIIHSFNLFSRHHCILCLNQWVCSAKCIQEQQSLENTGDHHHLFVNRRFFALTIKITRAYTVLH